MSVNMSPDWIIAALALVTIGGVLALSAFHFGIFLKDPRNVEAAKRVAEDRESATTKFAAEGVNGRSLRQRLNEAPGIDDALSARSSHSHSIRTVLFDTKWSEIMAVANADQGRGRL